MDITSRNRFWQTVHQLAGQGKTIIFSTHYLQEADDAADQILLFKDGAIVAVGTPAQIKARISTPTCVGLRYGHLLSFLLSLIRKSRLNVCTTAMKSTTFIEKITVYTSKRLIRTECSN